MADAQISFGPKIGLLNNAKIGEIYYDQLRPLLRGIDALVQPSVLSSSVTTPPNSPANGDAYILLGTTPAAQVVTYTVQHATPPNDFLSFTNTTSPGSLIFAYEGNTAADPLNNKLFGTQSMVGLNGDDGWVSVYLLNSTPGTTVSPFQDAPPLYPASNNPNWVIAEFPAAFNIFDQSFILGNGGNDWALVTTNQPGSAALIIMTALSFSEVFTAAAGLPVGWTPLLYNFSDTLIQGSVTSGTFVTGETVTQTGTGATATLTDAPTFSSPMPVSGLTGTPNATGTWTGGTSGAVYTPTTLPVPCTNVAAFYKIVTTPNTPVTVDWPGGIVTGAQFTLSSFNTSPAEIPGVLTSGGTVAVTNVVASNNQATITANNSFYSGGGQVVSFNLTNATFLNGTTFVIASATSTDFVVQNINYNTVVGITEIAISSDEVTVTAPNSFNPGDMVTMSQLSNASFLNGLTFPIDTANSTSFTFHYSYPDYGPTSDYGYASVPTTYPSTSEPSGATATVTFIPGETVYQGNSGATAQVVGLSPSGGQLILSSPLAKPDGYVDATDVWTGQTSQAAFTPTSLPVSTPYQNTVSGTGAWAGKLNQIAVWSTQVTLSASDTLAPAWDFYVPQAGWTAWVDDLGAYLSFDGVAWDVSQGQYVQTNPSHSQEMNIPSGTSFTATQRDGLGGAFFSIVDRTFDGPNNPNGGITFNVATGGTAITANYGGITLISNQGGITGTAYNTSFVSGSINLTAYDSNLNSSYIIINPNVSIQSIKDVDIMAQGSADGGYGNVNLTSSSNGGVFVAGGNSGVAVTANASGINLTATAGGVDISADAGGISITADSGGMSITSDSGGLSIFAGGGLTFSLAQQTSDNSIVTTRTACDATSGPQAANLPAANSVPAGSFYIIKKIDSSANVVTVTAAGSDLIDGNTTYSLSAQYKYVSLFSDGSANWYIDGSN